MQPIIILSELRNADPSETPGNGKKISGKRSAPNLRTVMDLILKITSRSHSVSVRLPYALEAELKRDGLIISEYCRRAAIEKYLRDRGFGMPTINVTNIPSVLKRAIAAAPGTQFAKMCRVILDAYSGEDPIAYAIVSALATFICNHFHDIMSSGDGNGNVGIYAPRFTVVLKKAAENGEGHARLILRYLTDPKNRRYRGLIKNFPEVITGILEEVVELPPSDDPLIGEVSAYFESFRKNRR